MENNKGDNEYLLNRKIKVLIADDEKKMIDEILLNLKGENADYEIIGYALSDEEERKKIEELKPDVVITDIYRVENNRKKAGGLEIIKEYSERYFLPKFIILSYIPDDILYTKQKNVIGSFRKFPDLDYKKLRELLHVVKITERSSFIRGYEERKLVKEDDIKKIGFIEKIRMLFN